MKLHLDLGSFDTCPAFNDWLDEQYLAQKGMLDIFGYQPRPSFILFSLSQDTYQAAFDDFRRQREDQIKETVCNSFPSPIAHYFYRFENGYENELQRLHLLRDTWEAIIDILHAIAVAECRFLRLSITEPLTFNHIWTRSVAQRLLNIERILDFGKRQNIDLGIERIIVIDTLQTMRDLNQSRNAFSHSAAQSESQARQWIGECYEEVIDVLDDLQGLADIQLGRYIGHKNARTARWEVFRGHGFSKTISSINLTEDQVRDSTRYFQTNEVLVVSGQRVFGITPLVYFREEASGHVTRPCVFRGTHGEEPNRTIEYEVVGEGTRWSRDRAVFQAQFDDLRTLFGIEPERGDT